MNTKPNVLWPSIAAILLIHTAAPAPAAPPEPHETSHFVEWLLDAPLTPSERTALDTTPFDARLTEVLRQLQSTVEELPAAQRASLRAQIQAAFLKSLRENPANPASATLLAAYQRSHGAATGKPSIPPQLVGQWSSVSTSSVTFTDGAGSFAPPSGNGVSFTFFANGGVEVDFMVQSTLYGCTVNVFMADKGRAQVDGATLRIDTAGAAITSRDNCNASGNYRKTGTPKRFQYDNWRISRDQWGEKLCLAEAGKEPECYYRR